MPSTCSLDDQLKGFFKDLEELISVRGDLPDTSATKLDKVLEAIMQDAKALLLNLAQLAYSEEHLVRFKVIRKELLALGAVLPVMDEVCDVLVDLFLRSKSMAHRASGKKQKVGSYYDLAGCIALTLHDQVQSLWSPPPLSTALFGGA